jgi:hypothetical protein
MVALLIAVGALLIAVIGCALLDPWPSAPSEVADQQHEHLGHGAENLLSGRSTRTNSR